MYSFLLLIVEYVSASLSLKKVLSIACCCISLKAETYLSYPKLSRRIPCTLIFFLFSVLGSRVLLIVKKIDELDEYLTKYFDID